MTQLDTVCFNIIAMDDKDIIIQKRTTRLYCYLHCTKYMIIILAV